MGGAWWRGGLPGNRAGYISYSQHICLNGWQVRQFLLFFFRNKTLFQFRSKTVILFKHYIVMVQKQDMFLFETRHVFVEQEESKMLALFFLNLTDLFILDLTFLRSHWLETRCFSLFFRDFSFFSSK